MKRFIVLVAFLMVMLMGCTNGKPSFACVDITSLQKIVAQEFTQSKLVDWIEKTYQVSSDEIKVSLYLEGTEAHFDWNKGKYQYGIILENNVVDRIGVINAKGDNISVNIVASCFSEPGASVAFLKKAVPQGGYDLSLDLIFPHEGVIVHGGQYYRDLPAFPVTVNGNAYVNVFFITKPGTPEGILEDLYSSDPSVLEEELGKLHPWPGDWSKITVDVAPTALETSLP